MIGGYIRLEAENIISGGLAGLSCILTSTGMEIICAYSIGPGGEAVATSIILVLL